MTGEASHISQQDTRSPIEQFLSAQKNKVVLTVEEVNEKLVLRFNPWDESVDLTPFLDKFVGIPHLRSSSQPTDKKSIWGIYTLTLDKKMFNDLSFFINVCSRELNLLGYKLVQNKEVESKN